MFFHNMVFLKQSDQYFTRKKWKKSFLITKMNISKASLNKING